MFRYLALVTEIISEESILLTVDLGFGVLKIQEFRLAGIDFSEFRGTQNREKAALIKKTLTEKLLNKEVTLKSLKSEKSGTYLAFIYMTSKESSYNDELIASGLVKPFIKRPLSNKQ